MEIKSFDTILVDLCDYFDNLIAPKTIARTNTNIIYLLFKAIAKGIEVLNNLCYVVSHKFDPANCSEEDLVSVSFLVGTEKRGGTGSGLRIKAVNTGTEVVTLAVGTYTYKYNDDVQFIFEVTTAVTLQPSASEYFIAVSEQIGEHPVTEQASIDVTADVNIPSDVTFSCEENSGILGRPAETSTEFRQRILTDATRQNTIIELQDAIKNLPYIFDCQVYFNDTDTALTYDGITIPSYYLAIFYSGSPRNEIAKVVAEKTILPTVETDSSVEVRFSNTVFASGWYSVHLIPFDTKEYTVDISYKLNSIYADPVTVQEQMTEALMNGLNGVVHKDYIRENAVYNILNGLNIAEIEILNVDLKVNGSEVSYVEIPKSRIPSLTSVSYQVVDD